MITLALITSLTCSAADKHLLRVDRHTHSLLFFKWDPMFNTLPSTGQEKTQLNQKQIRDLAFHLIFHHLTVV